MNTAIWFVHNRWRFLWNWWTLKICLILLIIPGHTLGNEHCVAPRITVQSHLSAPAWDALSPGSRVILTCSATGTPSPEYRWTKDNSTLSFNEALESPDWIFDSVSSDNNGLYRCIAENPCGSVVSSAFQLSLPHMSQFDPVSEPIRTVSRGEAVILQPPAINSIPPAMLSWTGDGLPISPTGNNRKYVVTLDSALVILDADVGDSKHYRLEAVNRQLNQTKTSDPIGVIVNDVPVSVESAPHFVIRPRNVTAKLGDALAAFECIVNARPLPALHVLWRRKDGESLQADGINYLITSNGYRMTILNPGPALEGIYECVAGMAGFENVTAAVHLTIAASPKIVQAPDVETHADLGRSVTIRCGVRGKPAPTVTWYKNSKQITPDWLTPGISSKFNLLDDGSLEMTKIEDGDIGVYQCFVRNAAGEESTSTWLRIKRSTKTDIPVPVTITVVENQSAQLNCPGVPPHSKSQIMWYFNGAPVMISGSHYQIDDTGSLMVPFASKSMEGTYLCQPGPSSVSANHSVTLIVTERTRITNPPKDTRLIIGSKVSFPCGINKHANVSTDIHWYQDGKLLDSATLTARRQILSNGNLVINSARSSDIGLYTCRAYSLAGNDSQSARLDVIELPYAPHIRAELINGTKSVNVSWMPDFDGNSPIIRFILQYKQFSSSSDSGALMDLDWQTLLSNFSATDRFYVVKDLRPSASYQFRVSAVNNVGEGAASSASHPIELPQTPPSSPPKVVVSARNATAIMVQWQPPSETDWNGVLQGYIIRYKLAGYSDLSWTEVPLSEEGRRNCILDDLIPWKMYEIQMAACNNKGTGIWSDSVRVRTQEGAPEAAPTDVLTTPLSSTSLSVSWKPPDPQHINGVNQGYRLEVWKTVNTSGPPIRSIEMPPSPYDPSERLTATLDSLEKYTVYFVTVLCFTGAGPGPRSAPSSASTMEDTPGPVHNLHVFDIRDRTIKLSWNLPEHQNGVITDFVIECGQLDTVTNATFNVQKFRLAGDKKNFTVENLQPQTNYMLRLFAETKAGAGEVRVVRIRSSMPPTLPCSPSNIRIHEVEARKALVLFEPVCDGNTSILQINVDVQTRELKLDEWKRFLEITENTSVSSISLEKLGPSVEYRIRLSVDNVVGQSAPSQPSDWFQTLADSPSNPPSDLTLRAINATAIRARWTPLVTDQWNGKTGSYFLVFRSLNDTTPVTQSIRNVTVNDSSAGSLVLANLEEFTQYEVRIAAVNTIGSSDQSGPVLESTRESVPSQSPSNVLVHAIGSSKIVVQWGNISALHHNGILLGYDVYYSNGHDQRVLSVGDSSSHHATLYDLEKYAEYSIQVAGQTRMGSGIRSSPLLERTLEDYPDPPYKVTFPQVTETQVRMSWEPPLHPHGRILGYRVSYKQEGSTVENIPVFLPPESNSFTAPNLHLRAVYTFTLVANTSVGWGPGVELLVKTISQREIPERPGRPSVSISMIKSRALSISWRPGPLDENAPVRYYHIQYTEGGPHAWRSVTERVEGKVTSFSVRGLTPNVGYKFCVQAVNDVGVSEWSDESEVGKTAEDVPETAPTAVTAVPYTTSSLTISWKAPASGLNGDLQGYILQYHRLQPGVFGGNIPFEEIIVKHNTTTHNLTDLARDSTYEIRVAAATHVGKGPFTPIIAAFVGEAVPLIRPSDVVVGVSSSSAVSVSWHAPYGIMDPSITGYKVFYLNTASSEEHIDFVPPSSTRHQIRSLRPFTTYTISIAIFNSAGDGPKTGSVNATTMESIPDPPEKLSFVNIQLTQVTVTWEPPKRLNGILRGYLLLCHAVSTEKVDRNFTALPMDNALTIGDLEEAAAYVFSIRAETGRGFGNWTRGNVTVGPQTGSPSKPTNLAAEMSENSVNMRWINNDKGQGPILGYLIQGRKDGAGSWDTLETLDDGLADFHQLSYLNLLPGTRYRFRVVSYNAYGVSFPSEASVAVQTPNWNSVVGIAPKRPFYMEVWFLILVAAVGSIFVILLIACLCIKSKAAKYRQEVEKVTSTADMLQFPDDDEFAAPTAFELRQSMRRSARKIPAANNNIYATSTTNSLKRKTTVSSGASRPPPFIIAAPPTGIVPSIAYSDIGDTSDIYPPHINRGFVNEGSSRASSSLTEKPSELHESSTDEVDDVVSADGEHRLEREPDERSSSFVNHYANLNNTLRKPWLTDGAGTSDSRRLPPPRMMEEPPRPPYRRSTATSISASIADSDSTSASLNGHLLININNKPGSRNPLPGFSSFV